MTGVTRQVGTVSAVDADKVQARVRLPECDNLRTNWLNVLQRNTQDNKDYWLPDVGSRLRCFRMPTARMVSFWARCTQKSINRRSATKRPGHEIRGWCRVQL